MSVDDLSEYVHLEDSSADETSSYRKHRRIGGIVLGTVVAIALCEIASQEPQVHLVGVAPSGSISLASSIARGIFGQRVQQWPRFTSGQISHPGVHALFHRVRAEPGPPWDPDNKEAGPAWDPDNKEVGGTPGPSIASEAAESKGLVDSILEKSPLPSYAYLLTSGVVAIAFVGCLYQLFVNDPPAPVLGVPVTAAILITSFPTFPLLFVLAITKGNREADAEDARYR
eukprot:gnl/MRDRNA2_/MRDRNA2_35889_c0_seq1.p1 gnl/MRDRNA2_/MRDRNA2_35889_c0~~gnl/MRDRNA2_/MRDRNA2_35889_c0_seq1.p1  ORF type:complete len:228 (+),score=17.25 gnl/MRDRNA2_/MRDRNA2_35889_c0_seq1:76-759(+)